MMGPTLSGVRPPIATRGTPSAALCRSRSVCGAAAGDLGGGREEGAEGHIAGAGRHGLLGIGQLVVAGGADDGLGTEQRARAGDVPVGAAQMHAGGAHGLGQHRIVVDDQRHAVGGAQALQGRRLFLPQRVAGGLVAVLQPVAPAASSGAVRASRRAVSGSSGVIR